MYTAQTHAGGGGNDMYTVIVSYVRNALMTLDFAFTIMHYVILYHFMVMLSSCDSLSCHALDFCVLQVIINFLAASAG